MILRVGCVGSVSLALLCIAHAAPAQVALPRDTSVHVRLSGFIDSYFAWDFGRPPNLDRAFTTQAARHSEANVNLAYLDATLSGDRVRGRLAIQYGTSVQVNYAGEPTLGTVSGPQVSRFLQEAFAGYRVTRIVWIDGGIMLAPFGGESWISRDNWTYTRSLIADNSPYYEAGVRVTWQAAPDLEAQLHVLNGWQNISETNEDKALAARLQWTPTPKFSLVYDNFVGNEAPASQRGQPRLFQEIVARNDWTDRLSTAVAFDWGAQRRATTGRARWNGYAALARYRATPTLGFGARVEGYADREQVIVKTATPIGMRAVGASLNADVQLDPRLLWRGEVRVLENKDPVFPDRTTPTGLSKQNSVVIVSLALSL